ncbi:serine/threonine-protein kinase [Streptomyces lincolnensis]|uniref:serine/threonine-protein kinase n=1 Tax=Streptomyces lincolnensis TaxID=1915 RepID=UPI0037D9866F
MLIAGRYRLNDPIGRGAMGEVWRAVDETLGRPVAVKLLLPHGSEPTAASRFRLEAQTAGRLNHPYVVGVYDFGEYDGRLFLVMELVEGDSLARLLSTEGPLPAGRVARIAAQAAAGLAAAHQQGIVHRDIKPANLLLDAEGTLKIGDFGIARFVDDPSGALTTTGQIVGTSLYLAPERALGQPAGPAADVYALGCLLYQLLTGQPPFQADTAVAILHQHLDTAPVPPGQRGARIPPAFENYLLGLLAKKPEDRPTAQQIAEWFAGGAWEGRAEPLPDATPQAGPDARSVGGGASRSSSGPASGVRAGSRPGGRSGSRSGSGSTSRSRPRSGSTPAAGSGAAVGPGTPAGARAGFSPGGGAGYPTGAGAGGGFPSGAVAGGGAGFSTEAGPATTYALPSTAGRGGRTAHGRTARRPQGSGVQGALRRRPRVVATVAAVVIFVAAMLAGMAWFSPGHSSAESPSGGTTPPVTNPAATPTPGGTAGLSNVTVPSPTAPQPGGDEDENEPDENEN